MTEAKEAQNTEGFHILKKQTEKGRRRAQTKTQKPRRREEHSGTFPCFPGVKRVRQLGANREESPNPRVLHCINLPVPGLTGALQPQEATL